MSGGPGPGTVLVALFLIVSGGCVALIGGGCTVFLIGNIGEMFHYNGMLGLFLLFLSVGALVVGLFTIRAAFRLLNEHDD